MSNNIYSDQVNNSNLYANKLFYGEEDDNLEDDLLHDCKDEIRKVKDKLMQCKRDAVESETEITQLEAETSKLKLQVQEEKGKVDQAQNEADEAKDKLMQFKNQAKEEREAFAECKKKVDQAQNEADEAKDKLMQFKNQAKEEREAFAECKKKVDQAQNEADEAKAEVEKFKNQAKEEREKVEQTKNEAKAAKAEAEQAKLEAKLAKEEVLRYKIEQEKEEVIQSKIEGVKEELLKCKINMAKAETEWYKKAAEECKNEKGIGIDKSSIRGEDENDRGKHVINEGGGTDKDKPVINGGGDKDGEVSVITSQEITYGHADPQNCGASSKYYKTYNQIGHHGFSTSELLEAFHPEMYSNPKIAEHLKMGSKVFYGAVNYKFAFSEPLDYSWGNASNMWCKKCSDIPSEVACQVDGIRSFCYSAGYYENQNYNESFFAERTCPNLVKISGTATIKAKQVAPLILVNSSGEMIDKEGNNTQVHYDSLKPYLKLNGKISDCGNDQKCKDYNAIMEKVAWDSDKEVLLKTVFNDTQRASPYYEDNSVSDDTNFI